MTKTWLKQNTKWLLLVILCFLIEAIGSIYFQKLHPEEIYGETIDQLIIQKKNEFERIRNDDSLMSIIRSKKYDEQVISNLRTQKVMVLLFEGDQLNFWTSVAIDESIKDYKDSSGFGIAKIKRGWYLYNNVIEGNKSIMLCYPLYRLYQVSNNPMLDEGFNSDLGIQAKADWSFSRGMAESFQIGKDLFNTSVYVRVDDKPSPESPWYLKLLNILGLVFLSILLFNSFEYLEQNHSYFKAWMFLGLSIFSLRALSHLLNYPYHREDYLLFQPDFYYLNQWIPSIGDLLVDSILLFIITFSAFKGALIYSRKRINNDEMAIRPAWVLVIASVAIHLFTALILSIIQSLISHSSLNYDITNILNASSLTPIGLLVTAMLLSIHLLWVNVFAIFVKRIRLKDEVMVFHLLIGSAIFIGLLFVTGYLEKVIIIQTISYLTAVYITLQLVSNQSYFQRTAAIIITISLFASSLFYRTIHDRELVLRQQLAERIYSPKDANAESLFLDLESKLEYDGFITEYFRSPVLQKSLLEKRIKQLYFSGYLSRFELEIFDFDTLGFPFKEMNDYSYEYLEEVYNSRTLPTRSNHFYLVNEPSLRFGYLAKYEVCTPDATLGKLFILLKPKFIQDEKIFTELLSNNPDGAFDLSAYSYATYQAGSLINHSGPFPYSLNFDFDYTKRDQIVLREGYSHLVQEGNGGILVVISKKQDTFLEPLTIFSFLFLSFSLFVFAVFISNLLFMWLRIGVTRFGGKRRQLATFYGWMSRLVPYRRFRGLYFSTRIQLSMIGLVLVALLLTGYFTIQYISFKYSQRQEERLDGKVKSVLSAIENERRFGEMMAYQDELTAYLNQLAEFYNTDINLFDLNGRLIASTQMRIFEGGMLLNRINPLAYSKISHRTRSQHTQNERIGRLDYLATYVPIFNHNQEMIAFMNVPFFSNERELRRELSSFLESFINIYVFFFILAGIFAFLLSKRVTKPLIVIQERLASTRLGNRNERLEWRQNDEIGQLVKQYNSMLKQLERSAELLARSEREDAWKEMARQIAHEIKNPLTPMKLSVQHLQRAWADNNENLEATFKRVTKVLIEQIDSLSLLATQFSSFSQMPVAKPELIELSDIVSSTVELYFNSPDIEIHFSSDKEKLELMADKNQLSRAFHNILKNAIQSIPEDRKGKVIINLFRKNQWAYVEVRDNGCGMSQEVANRIFTPSFSTKNSGMGLGLAITKQIVENAGGKIRFNTIENQGSTFTIQLPMH